MLRPFTSRCVTRLLSVPALVISFLLSMGALLPVDLFYSHRLIFKHHQYWRLFTSVMYFDRLGYMSFLDLLFFSLNLHQIETKRFAEKPLDMLVFVIMGFIGVWIYSSWICPVQFFGSAFSSYVAYYYSRAFPDIMFPMIGVPIPILSAWVPVVFLLADIGRGLQHLRFTIYTDLLAHLYFFIADVVPVRYCVAVLRFPRSWNAAAAPYLQS
jgi:Derlin-2/3